ncbi:hypothetical protein N0V83_001388 [Neocucurbitaria cava]|uniref:F-box domain-containing protein n=1 Tax=Neocucurbitaria cava TaxID=798079 RepID=A0A9W8YG35_9PLEO|nr:hypothetical protein N0V83_001388 [Neocucurbitaria cava]
MADLEPKKSGFRAMFGMRPSKQPGTRKKLSKKGSASSPAVPTLGSSIVANPQRQDSGSFTSQSIDLDTTEALLPTYEDISGFVPRNFRDSPYAAADPVALNNHTYLQPPQPAEYRRNSEGEEQYAAPLYKPQSSRSASTPNFPDVLANPTVQPGLVAKAPPAKLSKAHRATPRADDILDKDTGERKDLTDMMHAFTFNEELDIIDEKFDEVSLIYDPSKPDGTAILGSASPEIWLRVADFLSPLDVANLSSTCRTMSTRLGRYPYKLLLDPINRPDRLNFLLAMDYKLPRHLLCFPCAQWHLRIQPGLETLKPHNVLNPLFECPNRTNILLPPPRIRITDGRTLPFAFVQLARRSWEFGFEYGIQHQSLARRWKDPYSDWAHESTYHVTDAGHVLMRVKSQHYVEGGMTDAAKRLLLFTRGDYTPYFSVCSHWKNGMLTSIPKCALDHIPFVHASEQYAMGLQLREKAYGKKATGLVSLCSRCRPMRRCPECPTEYLFELKFLEDKSVRGHGPERFKQALLVTRWSDLGPARSPADAEWSAIVGENENFDSFLEIGRRAVSGVFESAFTDTIPGQRILSMNPKNLKADDVKEEWY